MRTLVWIIRKKTFGALCGLLIIAWVIVALFAAQIAPYSPNSQDWQPLQPPGPQHLMGTDRFGCDVFSRVVFSSRVSIFVGISTVALALVASLVVGIVTGYLGGAVDLFGQRIVDVLMSFPPLLLAMLLSSLIGASLGNVIMTIAFVQMSGGIRIVRSYVLSERDKEYVLAAKASGCSSKRVCFLHILPNVVPLAIITAAGAVGSAILIEAGLSFLGLGVPLATPTWGGELNTHRAFFVIAPWTALYPGLALTTVVLGFNVLGDTLRDALDPWIRRGRG